MESTNERVNKIVNLLEDKGAWERRVDGLRLLRALFKEDISALGPDVAQGVATRIRQPLKAQLEDLRSQISKEACGCVVAFCNSTLTDVSLWEHCSDWFLGPLINGACVTVAVISKGSSEALHEIALSGRINKNVLQMVTQGCSHKHSTYRRVSAQFLLTSLHYANDAFLLKGIHHIQKAIRDGVGDQVVDVRKVARLAFWALEALHEDSAVLLYEGLDPTIQRAVDGEKSSYNAWAQTQGQRVTKLSASVDSRLESSMGEAAGLHLSRNMLGESVNSIRGGVAGSGPLLKKKSLSSSVRGAPTTATNSKTTSAQRIASPSTKRPSTTTTSSTLIKRKSLSASVSGRHTDPLAEARAQFRASPSPASSASRRVPSSQQAPPQQSSSTPETTWSAIVGGLNNADWSSRSIALVELAQFVDLGMATGDEARIQEAVSLASRHLKDTHHKVILSAVTAYSRLLATFPHQCFTNIEPALVAHFGNLTAMKEPVRVAAIQQLGSICETYPADSLYKPILKVIDTVVTGKTKLGATEYLLHVVQSSRRTFAPAMVLTPFILRLFKVVKAHTFDSTTTSTSSQSVEARDTTHSLLTILAELYSINSDEFVSSIVSFPSADHRHIVRLLEGLLPQLSVDCKKVKDGQRLPPSGENQVSSPFDKMLRQCTPNRVVDRKQNQQQGLSVETSRTLEPLFAEVEMSPPNRDLVPSARKSSKMAEELEEASGAFGASGTPFERSFGMSYNPADYDGTLIDNTDVVARRLRTSAGGAEVGSPLRTAAAAQPSMNGNNGRTSSSNLPSRAANALASLKSDPVVIQRLSRAKSIEEKRDAMELASNSIESEPRLWSARFNELLPYAIAFTTDPQHTIRMQAYQLMVSIYSVRYLRPISVEKLEHVMRAVLTGLNDSYPEVQREVLGLLRVVCGSAGGSLGVQDSTFPLEAIYEALSTILEEAGGSTSLRGGGASQLGDRLSTPGGRALLRETGQLAKSTVDPFLSQSHRSVILSRIIPLYLKAFGNSNCDVRKAVTICIVDWYSAIGEEMHPFLLSFQDTQLRIVSVYYNRARSDMAGGGGGGGHHVVPIRIEDEIRSYRNLVRAEEEA